jgi:hypothetical protein
MTYWMELRSREASVPVEEDSEVIIEEVRQEIIVDEATVCDLQGITSEFTSFSEKEGANETTTMWGRKYACIGDAAILAIYFSSPPSRGSSKHHDPFVFL